MQMVHDSLLRYSVGRSICLCHLRVYEGATADPIAVVGELSDGGSPVSITNSIEQVAFAIAQDYFFGRSTFRLVHQVPGPSSSAFDSRFLEVTFHGTAGSPFESPNWQIVDVAQLLKGAPIRVWRQKYYTVYAVAGIEGERIREDVAFYNSVSSYVRAPS